MVTNFQIFEAKQVGILYHFTSLGGFKDILEQNLIRSGSKYVSLTRTKNPYKIYGREHREVRIVLDGNKLSNNYKIEPYNDFPDDYKKDKINRNKIPVNDETEERVILLPKHKIKVYLDGLELTCFAIKDIKKYIIRIDILNKRYLDTKEIMKEIIEKNPDIEINIIEKW